MQPPFEKAFMEKESVVKCYYDASFFKGSIQRLYQSHPLTIPFIVVFLLWLCNYSNLKFCF